MLAPVSSLNLLQILLCSIFHHIKYIIMYFSWNLAPVWSGSLSWMCYFPWMYKAIAVMRDPSPGSLRPFLIFGGCLVLAGSLACWVPRLLAPGMVGVCLGSVLSGGCWLLSFCGPGPGCLFGPPQRLACGLRSSSSGRSLGDLAVHVPACLWPEIGAASFWHHTFTQHLGKRFHTHLPHRHIYSQTAHPPTLIQ